MNRREFVISTFAGAIGFSDLSRLAAQAKAMTPDLGALADGKSLKVTGEIKVNGGPEGLHTANR